MKPINEYIKEFEENPLVRSGGFYPFRNDMRDILQSTLEARDKEWRERIEKVVDKVDGLQVSTSDIYELLKE